MMSRIARESQCVAALIDTLKIGFYDGFLQLSMQIISRRSEGFSKA
jgi:hypothetical protein